MTTPSTAIQDDEVERDDGNNPSQSWKASLLFDHVEGSCHPVDLFQYTDKEKYKRRHTTSQPLVIFDRTRFQNTPEGLNLLLCELKKSALLDGTTLISRKGGIELRCHRCRIYQSHKKSPTNDNHLQFDEHGRKNGTRKHAYHRDRGFARNGGRSCPRNTATCLPISKEEKCNVFLRLGIQEGENGFIYLKQGCGNCIHTNHPQPFRAELALQKRHIGVSTQTLIRSGGNANVGSTSMRSLILEHQSELVSKGTVHHIQLEPEFLSNAQSDNNIAASTAEKMVSWLRAKANDPTVNLHYCFLTCSKDTGAFHKHSKGRCPKQGRMPLSDIENAMSLTPSYKLESVFCKARDKEINTPLCEGPAIDNDLVSSARQHISGADRILLGAAWVDDANYQQFLRFPEVLFIDSTHKTNNEARPLLLLCGRDQNGKAFVVARIFMPNETIAFYRWVFLKCLPSLLGTEAMLRVRLLITDGDSQEFDAAQEACLHFFKNAARCRCMFHLVQKSVQRHIAPSGFNTPLTKQHLQKVKSWVYSWADGSSCFTERQYIFSKELLLHRLQTDDKIRKDVPLASITAVIEWLNTKVFPYENSFCFWKKTYLRCLDKYMNNSVEAMNKSCKKSGVSAKPNMNMDKAANAMLTYTELQSRMRRSTEARKLCQTPIFLDPSIHNVWILRQLCDLGQHLMVNQFQHRVNYSVLCTSPTSFLVLLHNKRDTCASTLEPPRYKTAWEVQKDEKGWLRCKCGYSHRYGIPCRHLLAVEPKYDLLDIDSRWLRWYGYFAYHPGRPNDGNDCFHESTGIRHKTDLAIEGPFPFPLPGCQLSANQFLAVSDSSHLHCWNYNVADYPQKHRGLAVESGSPELSGSPEPSCQMFTQESTAPDMTEGNTIPQQEEILTFSAPIPRTVSQAQVHTFFKDMLPLFNCPSSRKRLYEKLEEERDNQETRLREKQPKIGDRQNEVSFVSSNVPFDKSCESIQNTYHFKN